MTDQPARHTADTITDDQLDELYARIATLEAVAESNKRAYKLVVPDVQAAEQRAEQAEAAKAALKRAHDALAEQAGRDQAALTEARQWARHGYEIGQRHCGWTDHGVAPGWLTEGWPRAIDSCEHLQQYADLDMRLTRARASTILQARRWAARARTAEATLERLEARIDAVLEPQEPTP